MRVSYWLANNPAFGIKNLKICNITDFARKVRIKHVHALIHGARSKAQTELAINGWIITWSYKTPLDEVLEGLNITIPVQEKKSPRKAYTPRLQFPKLSGRKCLN